MAGSIVLVSINNDPGFTELQKLCFICNSNRHFKIQSFNEAVPKYTQANPRRVSDVPKGVGVAKQKVLKEFMFQ